MSVVSSYHERSYSSGRGFNGATLASGLSSAGAVCTTQLRDGREREKREIGVLNDRLADYIEKVRFLEAQNRVLSQDIEHLRRGFTGGSQVSHLFESEITHWKQSIQQVIADRGTFDRDVGVLSTQLEEYKRKWLEAVTLVRSHRSDHSTDLDRLAKVEAEVALYRRKIGIVEEDVIRVKRENDIIYHQIGSLRSKIHHEVSLKTEFSAHIQDLIHRVKHLETDNSVHIERELVYISRDTTAENRDYFRSELHAAIRDIRADYEVLSHRNREQIEEWYRQKTHAIHAGSVKTVAKSYDYQSEITTIRTTLSSVKTRVSELESSNYQLEKTIEDLSFQLNEDARFYEISLSEKEDAIARLRKQCTELTIQMEKLCDVETSLRAEIEKYRVLLNGANVTAYTSATGAASTAATTRVTKYTSHSSSSQNEGYTNVHQSSRSGGYSVGGSVARSIASPAAARSSSSYQKSYYSSSSAR